MSTPDKNYRSYADAVRIRVEDEVIYPPDHTYADALKLSNVSNAEIKGCHIYGGKEDCIDINRGCQLISISKCDLIPAGKYAVTIKGGSRVVCLSDVIIHDHGAETDIDIGNWSDQSAELTTGVYLNNVTMVDGSPVRCRVLWGEAPTVAGGNVKVTVVPRVLVWAWRWLRKLKIVK